MTDGHLAAALDGWADLMERSGLKDSVFAFRRAAHVLRTAPQMEKALESCRKYIPGSEVRSWPPGHRLREEALKSSAAALDAYREGPQP